MVPGVGALLALSSGVVLMRREQSGARSLAAVLFAVAWWTLAAAFEMSAGSREGAVFWSRMAAFGIVSLGPLWLLFSWRYSHPDRPISWRSWGLLWAIPMLYLVLVWTNSHHGWVWPSVEWISETGRCRFGHGPAKWGMAICTYGLLILGANRIFSTVRRSSSFFCGQAMVLMIIFSIPLVANLLYLLRFNPWPEMDLTPPTLALSGALVAVFLFRRRVFDLFPLARSLVFQQMEEGVLVLDSRSRVLDANPAAIRLLEGVEPLAIGTEVGVSPAPSRFAGLDWQRLFAEGALEYQTPRARRLEMRVSPIRHSDGKTLGHLVLIRDVTAVQVEAQRRREMEERLRNTEKMELLGRLAGGVAHDFNNMLQAILGFTEMLLLDTPPSDPRHAELLEIQKASQRARDLTRQLLAFSRKQMLKPSRVDINDLVRSFLKMLTRLLGEDIRVETRLAPDLWAIWADPSPIEQALLNLCVNARDAMPRGGTLTITTANVFFDEATAASRADEIRPGRFVSVSVSDTGTGLSPEASAHLFEPFFTTKKGRGTGMGLASVYGIVKQHEGFVHVYSEPNRGSTFRLYFPAADPSSSAGPRPEEEAPLQRRGTGERVLLIEDEEEVRQMAERALRLNGYLVQSAASARDAIRLFESNPANWDAVLSDVILPDGNGLDLVERFRSLNDRLAVVLMSGFSDEKSRWPDIARQGLAFVQKPWSIPELLGLLREELQKQADSSDAAPPSAHER